MARKLKTGWVKIATSGPTVDGSGRVVEKAWLKAMAKNYDPEVYTAKIYPDHYRFLPNGGEVLALKTKSATNENLQGEIHLMAIIAPNDWLIEQNRNGQYVHPSIEVREDFMAGKFDFYLGGLGVTDDEGSSGTDRLEFSAKKDQPDHVFKGEKLNLADDVKKNFFSGLTKTTNSDDDEMTSEQFEAFKALLEENQNTFKTMASNFSALSEKVDKLVEDEASSSDDNSGGDGEGEEGAESDIEKSFKALTSEMEDMKAKFSALEQKPHGATDVPPADGADEQENSEIL